MREELLGYLLDALEPDERQALEARLQADPQLQRELALMRRSLGCLDHDDHEPEPTCGLAARTYRYVMARVGPCAGQFAACSQWRVQDMVVAGVIVAVGAMLFFPSVARSRYQAQLRGCQRNLADLGQALVAYSQRHRDYFPEVPVQGNLSIAGIYAPTLVEAGFIEPRHAVCPAADLARHADFRLPTLAELRAARGLELRRLQALAGGSYGYSFGYLNDGEYRHHRNLSRGHFALMADAPPVTLTGLQTVSANHPCCSQNVLFEDGRVQSLRTSHLDEAGDHIFTNGHGFVGAGIGPNDAVIGASSSAPIVITLTGGR